MPLPHHVPPTRWMARIKSLPWKHYFTVGIELVRQGQRRVLLGKLIRMFLAFFSPGVSPAHLLQWAKAEGRPLALVIDHDLGGGANLYRFSFVDRLRTEGFEVILLTAHRGMGAYQLIARRGAQTRTANVEDLDVLFDALASTYFEHVVFNNIISFPTPLAMVSALSNWLRQRGTGQFLFLVHDHYCICPSWLLLNNAGKFCGIPDTSVCASCLPANTAPFLDFARGIDVPSWRTAWRTLLLEADEIRCFSNTSRNLLLRAHAEVNPERVSVVPHTVDHVRLRKIALEDPGWPVIGVIGHIAYHKGALVLRDLVRHIQASKARARIVVIGTIKYDLPKEFVTITGPYRREQLPGLLETHGVNVGFFPSISPETFSYVTEEMMAMGLPILSFDFGAPGERVAKYVYGRVISLGDPANTLEAIEELYNDHVRALRA